jgi:hypothetical protein
LWFDSTLCTNVILRQLKSNQMRTRINVRVNVQDAIEQIENEIKSYSRAIKAIMELKQVEYRDAKRILEMRIDYRIMLKTN